MYKENQSLNLYLRIWEDIHRRSLELVPNAVGFKIPLKYVSICTYIQRLYKVLQREIYSGIPNATVWQVLRKRLYLKAYKPSIVQHLKR
jgi:hypothetical protein